MEKKYVYLIFVLFLFSMDMGAQIQYSVSFQRNKLELVPTMGADGINYTNLEYEDCVKEDQVSSPALPYKFLRFIVPNGSYKFTVSVDSTESESIGLSAPVYPTQPVVPNFKKYSSREFQLPDFEQYHSWENYPQETVSIVNEGYMDGDKRIITVKVAPVQYVAAENRLIFNANINFTIHFNTVLAARKAAPFPLSSVKGRLSGEELKQALAFVENPADIDRYAQAALPLSVQALNLPMYEYVIITSQYLAPAFDRLVSWKRMKGLNAGVVTLQSILADRSITKDEVSNLSDNAGKLRQYLRLAYQNGTKYVLLGGNGSIIPIRYGSGYANGSIYDSSLPYVDTQIPADLYYSDLNGNWNKDGDPYLGETEDAVDYYPELYVGRILCETRQEIENYIEKLIVYEKDPGKGDASYLKKAFYSQMNEMQSAQQAQKISKLTEPYFNQQEIYEEYPSATAKVVTFPSGKETIDKMNEKFGLITFLGHGEPYGIAVAQQDELTSDGVHYWTGITPYDSYCGNYDEEKGNGLDCLKNIGSPFVAYSTACTVTPFDKLLSDLDYNVGQGFTTAGKYGAVAFLGNTRYGWVGPSEDFMKLFVKDLPLYFFQLGKTEAWAKTHSMSYHHWLALAHNLIGCPETQMWTKVPVYVDGMYIVQGSRGQSVSLRTSTDSTTMVIQGLFGGEPYLQKSVGKTAVFENLPKNYAVMFYKYNYLPYIGSIGLQNEEVTGKHYLIGNKVFIGKFVDYQKAPGNFVIKSGADVTIEASGEVTLTAGFEVEKGAIVNFIR